MGTPPEAPPEVPLEPPLDPSLDPPLELPPELPLEDFTVTPLEILTLLLEDKVAVTVVVPAERAVSLPLSDPVLSIVATEGFEDEKTKCLLGHRYRSRPGNRLLCQRLGSTCRLSNWGIP